MTAVKIDSVVGLIFARFPSRPANGTTKQSRIVSAESGPQGAPARRIIQACSQGSLPYQITRYCDQNRYVQNTVKPNASLPRSWRCWSPIDVRKSGCSGIKRHTVNAVTAIPAQNAPMKNQPPKSVLYQCGSSDIAQSYVKTLITTAYTPTNTGPIVCIRCQLCTSSAS